jgi:ankyrin repeat protein
VDALLCAVQYGSVGLFELELSKGINIEDRSCEGRRALQLAAGCGSMSMVERLLKEGAEVNAPASKWTGRTALQAAAEGGSSDGPYAFTGEPIRTAESLEGHGAAERGVIGNDGNDAIP